MAETLPLSENHGSIQNHHVQIDYDSPIKSIHATIIFRDLPLGSHIVLPEISRDQLWKCTDLSKIKWSHALYMGHSHKKDCLYVITIDHQGQAISKTLNDFVISSPLVHIGVVPYRNDNLCLQKKSACRAIDQVQLGTKINHDDFVTIVKSGVPPDTESMKKMLSKWILTIPPTSQVKASLYRSPNGWQCPECRTVWNFINC